MSIMNVPATGPMVTYTQPEWNAWEYALKRYIEVNGPTVVTMKGSADGKTRSMEFTATLDSFGNVVVGNQHVDAVKFSGLQPDVVEFNPPQDLGFLRLVSEYAVTQNAAMQHLSQQMNAWSHALGCTFLELQQQAQENRAHAFDLSQREANLAYREGQAGAAANAYVSAAQIDHANMRVGELAELNRRDADIRVQEVGLRARADVYEAQLYTQDADRRADLTMQRAGLLTDDANRRAELAAHAANLQVDHIQRRADVRDEAANLQVQSAHFASDARFAVSEAQFASRLQQQRNETLVERLARLEAEHDQLKVAHATLASHERDVQAKYIRSDTALVHLQEQHADVKAERDRYKKSFEEAVKQSKRVKKSKPNSPSDVPLPISETSSEESERPPVVGIASRRRLEREQGGQAPPAAQETLDEALRRNRRSSAPTVEAIDVSSSEHTPLRRPEVPPQEEVRYVPRPEPLRRPVPPPFPSTFSGPSRPPPPFPSASGTAPSPFSMPPTRTTRINPFALGGEVDAESFEGEQELRQAVSTNYATIGRWRRGMTGDYPTGEFGEEELIGEVGNFQEFMKTVAGVTPAAAISQLTHATPHTPNYNVRRMSRILTLYCNMVREPTPHVVDRLGWEIYYLFRETLVLAGKPKGFDLHKFRTLVYGDVAMDPTEALVARCTTAPKASARPYGQPFKGSYSAPHGPKNGGQPAPKKA